MVFSFIKNEKSRREQKRHILKLTNVMKWKVWTNQHYFLLLPEEQKCFSMVLIRGRSELLNTVTFPHLSSLPSKLTLQRIHSDVSRVSLSVGHVKGAGSVVVPFLVWEGQVKQRFSHPLRRALDTVSHTTNINKSSLPSTGTTGLTPHCCLSFY